MRKNRMTNLDTVSKKVFKQRVIGFHESNQRGPLLIAIGSIHGNEKAGTKALNRVFDELNENDGIQKGIFAGVVGNMMAYKRDQRFIDVDLNRQWSPANVNRVVAASTYDLALQEEWEMRQLLMRFNHILDIYTRKYPDAEDRQVVMIDLHTFSANGRPYSIATTTGNSSQWARQLHVPAIIGMEVVVKGTTMHYFNDLELVSFGFEAGQHNDPYSVDVMEAAIWLTLVNVGCITKEQVRQYQKFEALLKKEGEGLPACVAFKYRHAIQEGDQFVMRPGYVNFQKVSKGEYLADDKNGKIYAPIEGMILMPLYQKQGEDGFFIVQDVDD